MATPNVTFIPVAEMAKGPSAGLSKDVLAERKFYENAVEETQPGMATCISVSEDLSARSISQRVRHAAKRLGVSISKMVITPESVQFTV